MNLMYHSTRDDQNIVTASQAILQGLATDGGLYVPTGMPKITLDFDQLAKMSYQEVAYLIMQAFLPDFTKEELVACINKAYDQKFSDEKVAPLKEVGEQYYLELFHGATIAFKDMALSILPHLMTTAAEKNKVDKEIVILTATSGDTGKAAMAGFADVPKTKIIVFYPKDGVSAIQERQMVTQKGENTFVVALDGNFDDAQSKVKELFNDVSLKEELANHGYQFSSANSINIGRLVPQIVYYVYAYAQLVKDKAIKSGDQINISVPTGNFGNILAGYYAKQIGVPINRLICASNPNKVLSDFFQTGTYDRNRPFFVTSSPSMDILISSNLERLIYHLTNDNSQKTKEFMRQLIKNGSYQITPSMRTKAADFYGNFASEEETKAEIKNTFTAQNYVEDPHTAVAAAVYRKYSAKNQDHLPTVIVATASPYKFPNVVVAALQDALPLESEDDFSLVEKLHELSKVAIPSAVTELKTAPIRHDRVIKTSQMKPTVINILGLD